MKKVLPIAVETKLNIECWTYYTLAVIQTLPDYMKWLSAHMNVYFGEMGEGLYYGVGPKPYKPEYYHDIVRIEEIDLYEIDVSEVVECVKNAIREGYYYVIFTREKEYAHEVFVYGYDDEISSFYSIALNEYGHFAPTLVEYNRLQQGFENNVRYFMEHPDEYYSKSDFVYVMSKLKPNYRYLKKNYTLEFFEKIYHEVFGTKTEINHSDVFGTYLSPKSYYTGVACLVKMRERINDLMDSRSKISKCDIQSIRKNLFKLYEHRALMVESMNWIEQTWEINDVRISELCNQYNEYVKKFRNICFLFLKYEEKNDISLLERISNRFEKQYHNEKIILQEYVTSVRQWHDSHILSNKFAQLFK